MLGGVNAASPSLQAFVPGPQESGPQPDPAWCHMESSTCLGLFLPDPGGLPGAGRLPLLLITGWQPQFSSWHCPAGRQNPRASSGGKVVLYRASPANVASTQLVGLEQNLSPWRLSNLAASPASLAPQAAPQQHPFLEGSAGERVSQRELLGSWLDTALSP